ncbi:hypothetical protein HispidOSU_013672, partial [Sigmodon hispidus]
ESERDSVRSFPTPDWSKLDFLPQCYTQRNNPEEDSKLLPLGVSKLSSTWSSLQQRCSAPWKNKLENGCEKESHTGEQ